MLKFIIAFSMGAAFGVGFMCCCIVAGHADRGMEEDLKDKGDIS